MKAVLYRKPIAEIRLTHQDQTITFSTAYFDKGLGKTFGDVTEAVTTLPLDTLNQYWASLTPSQQTNIFNIYANIRSLLNLETSNQHTQKGVLDSLQSQLRVLFQQLSELHTYDTIKHYVDYYSTYQIPLDIPDIFDTGSARPRGTVERTYTKADYKELVYLSVALRPYAIVIGEFITKVEQVVSKEWKELIAYYLLVNTWLYQTPALDRLDLYMQTTLDAELTASKEDYLAAAIIEGISTDDFPIWLLSQVVIKQVAWADYTSPDPKRANIVKSIYSFLKSKAKNRLTVFKSAVNNKDLELDVTDGSKMSLLESYKARMEIALGDISLAEHLITDAKTLALQLEPTLDLQELNLVLDLRNSLLAYTISDVQVRLVQWLINSNIPARILPYLDKPYVVTLLAISAVICKHRGFPSLAYMLLAYSLPKDTSNTILESTLKPSTQDLQILDSYYPFVRRSKAKQRTKANVALQAIERIFRELNQSNWYTLVPEHWLDASVGKDRHYATQRDLKVVLIKFVIDLNERIKHELPDSLQQPKR